MAPDRTGWRSARGRWVAIRVELVEEVRAALLLVGLADRGRRGPQALERAEEPPVGLVGPAHVPAPPPARAAQGVEPPVVADARVRVALDVVAPQLRQPGPRVEEPWPAGDDPCDGGPPLLLGCGQRLGERGERL